jgi:hypothetical protein
MSVIARYNKPRKPTMIWMPILEAKREVDKRTIIPTLEF